MAAKCKACSKSIYPMDPQINLDGTKFHKSCAKCSDCDCQITISNFTKNESSDQTVLLCKIHYFKRFHEGGSYLGGEKFRVKSTRDMKLPSGLPPSADQETSPPEVQSSVSSLKTVFNASKTEVPAPAKIAAPVVVAAVNEPVTDDAVELSVPTINTATVSEESPAPVEEEESVAEVVSAEE